VLRRRVRHPGLATPQGGSEGGRGSPDEIGALERRALPRVWPGAEMRRKRGRPRCRRGPRVSLSSVDSPLLVAAETTLAEAVLAESRARAARVCLCKRTGCATKNSLVSQWRFLSGAACSLAARARKSASMASPTRYPFYRFTSRLTSAAREQCALASSQIQYPGAETGCAPLRSGSPRRSP